MLIETIGNCRVMGADHERGFHFRRDVHQHFDNVGSSVLVELAGRFVGEEKTGALREGTCDGDALHLTAGELFGQFGMEVREVEPRERRGRAFAGFGLSDSGEYEWERHILDDVEGRKQARALEHDGDWARPE
jgi:hypothetical protein